MIYKSSGFWIFFSPFIWSARTESDKCVIVYIDDLFISVLFITDFRP